jgi:phosphoglucosamine mutase
MTSEMMQIGRAAAYIFKNGHRRHRIVIGKDTRLSGYMIENALAAGICSMLLLNIPTPAANITSSMRADAELYFASITLQDNGIASDGFVPTRWNSD